MLKKVLKSGDGRTYSPEAEFQKMLKKVLKVLKGDDKKKAWLESELQGMLQKVLNAWFEAKFQTRLKKALKGGNERKAWEALIRCGGSPELRALKPLVVQLAEQTSFTQSDLIKRILTGRDIHLQRWRIIGRQSQFYFGPRESEFEPVTGYPEFRGWTVEVNAPYLTKEEFDQIRSKLNRFRPDGFPLGSPIEVIEKAIDQLDCNPEPGNDEEWERVRQAVNKLYGYQRYSDLTGPKKCFQRRVK